MGTSVPIFIDILDFFHLLPHRNHFISNSLLISNIVFIPRFYKVIQKTNYGTILYHSKLTKCQE